MYDISETGSRCFAATAETSYNFNATGMPKTIDACY